MRAGVSSKLFGQIAQRGQAVNTAAEARDLLAEIAGPMRLGENVKSALGRVAERTGLGARRVRALWHGETRSLRPAEVAALYRAAREQKEMEAARAEYQGLDARLARIERALGLPVADADGPVADAAGTVRRPVDRG